MSRYMKVRCPICGQRYTQNWEEPDECPNGCEESDGDCYNEPDGDDGDDYQRDEVAEFGGMDIPDSKY